MAVIQLFLPDLEGIIN